MRKILVLLALAVVMAGSVGCSSCCRNLFRRGSPCFGTARVAPAMLAGPMAIASPVQMSAPVVQPLVMPQMMMQPPMMQQPACCPQVPCSPCPCECSPCESGIPGEYFGGYQGDGGCQNCGPTTTYNQGYLVPGAEMPQGNIVPGGSDTRTDPGPTTQN